MNQANDNPRSSRQWMKNFLPIWSAQIFSLLGSGLVQFALIWYLTKETGSATILAMATFVALIPDVLVAPFAGALVDRWNRRLVMIFADGSISLVTLGLAILFATNHIQVWHILTALFLREVGSVFHWPAMQSSTSLMVPEEHLSRVAGINQAIRGGLNIVAPPLGALLMSLMAFYQVILIDIVTAMIAITPLLFIRIPQPVRQDNTGGITPKVMVKDLVEGFKFMKAWPGILMLAMIAALINFTLAPSNTLMPLLVTKHFSKGVWELSLMESSLGIGVVVGGLLLGIWGGFKNRVITSMAGVIGIGLGVFLVGIAPANLFPLAVAGAVIMGFMLPMANGPLQAVMQSKIPAEMQGRAMSLTNAMCTAMMPLALLISAPIANSLGLQFWYWLGGLVTIAIGCIALFIPQVVHLEQVQISARESQVSID